MKGQCALEHKMGKPSYTNAKLIRALNHPCGLGEQPHSASKA